MARTLVMGSCDPHGLQLDDDRAPTCARRPAFAIATHLPADAQELAGRPLPPLNQAEEMEPLPPPSALPPSPPCVTQLSQVVAPKGLALVRTWMRRLRRSLRAAQRGDTRLAKRLRPADLWLGVEYMTPEARDWNWDLRPLALGQTAIPLAVSGRDGLEPPSSFDRSELGKDDSAFKDQAILSEMAQGMRDDSDCRRGTLLCAPHGSALEHFAVAEEKIAKGVTNGWLSAGWELPCWPIRTAPYGVVDESERAGEPKHRFTNDLSWPQQSAMLDDDGVPVDSLNGAMRREEWPRNRLMRIYEFSEGAAILGTAKARVELWGIDVKAYYRAFGRQGSEIWRSAFVDASGFTLDERCCFGSAADACKCARVSNYLAWQTLRALRAVDKAFPSREPHVLAWQAERRRLGRAAGATEEEIAEQWEALHTFGYYIDDGACASIADLLCYSDGSPVIRDGKQVRRSQLHFEAAKGVLKRFGLESATNKEQPPARSIVTLGIELNLDTNRMRVSEDKRKKYASRAGAMAELQTCGREEMVALLSRLQFAATCYPRGRQWLHAPWRAVRAQWRLRDGKVLVTKAVRRSLRKWARELNSPLHEGVPLASRAIREWGEGVCAIYADASGEQGWMAWSEHNGELLFTDGVWNEAVKGLPICDKELLASTWGLVALAPWTGAHQVMSFTDNTVAQAAMRSHTPSAAAMAHLVERRSEWLLERGYLESVHRITSKANLWADMGSRGDTGGVLLQALALGYKPRRLEVDEEWLRLAADAAQIRERESESECRADGKGIAGSPCTSSVPIPDCRKRTRAIGEGTKPSHRAVDEQAIDGGLGGPTRRSDPDRREALAQVQPLRAQHGANTTSRSRCTSGVEARGGNASDELRRVAGVVQAERKIHLAGIGEEVCGAGDRMDTEGAYTAHFAGGLELSRLRDLVKGMRREMGERPKRVRWGVRTQQLREAMDKCLPHKSSVEAQGWRAALTLAFCLLLRGGEVAVPSGEQFNPLQHLTRADIQVIRAKDGSLVLKLRLRVLKKRVMTGKTYTVFLRAGGKLIDAVREVLLYLKMDPVEPGMEKHTPLFRHANGEAFRREDVAAMVKRIMASIGLDPARFGAHSLRIGGATAALAAGVQPTLIRVLGRWSSDIYEIYCRLSLEAAAGMGALIGSTPFEDVEQGEFVTEDLEATSLELAALRHVELDPESEEEEL